MPVVFLLYNSYRCGDKKPDFLSSWRICLEAWGTSLSRDKSASEFTKNSELIFIAISGLAFLGPDSIIELISPNKVSQ
jgi:hypothetical protein